MKLKLARIYAEKELKDRIAALKEEQEEITTEADTVTDVSISEDDEQPQVDDDIELS